MRFHSFSFIQMSVASSSVEPLSYSLKDLVAANLGLDTERHENPGGSSGFSLWFTGSSSKKDTPWEKVRAFKLQDVTFTRGVKPVLPYATPFPDGPVALSVFKDTKLDLVVALDPVVHADALKYIREFEDQQIGALFEVRSKVFDSKKSIASCSLEAFLEKVDSRYVRDPKKRDDGKEPGLNIYPSVPGWSTVIQEAVVRNFKGQPRVTSVKYGPRTIRPPPVKNVPTVFAAIMGDDLVTMVPLRRDGALVSSAEIKKDAAGNDMWRQVGPQDVPEGSRGFVILDPVGMHVPSTQKGFSFKAGNALFVAFDPTTNSGYEALPDDAEVLLSEVDRYTLETKKARIQALFERLTSPGAPSFAEKSLDDSATEIGKRDRSDE